MQILESKTTRYDNNEITKEANTPLDDDGKSSDEAPPCTVSFPAETDQPPPQRSGGR